MTIVVEETINVFLQSNPTPESITSLTVPEFKLLCRPHGVEESNMRGFKKADFVDMVSQILFDDEQDGSEHVDSQHQTDLREEVDGLLVSASIDNHRLQSTRNPLPIHNFNQQMELMKMQLQLENAKSRRIQAELKLRTEGTIESSSITSSSFDLYKSGKFVPTFDEKEPNVFFF